MLLDICNELTIVPLSDLIVAETIRLRQLFKVKLPDAIIYATAVAAQMPLLTNNIADFKALDGRVQLIDPFTL